MEEEVLGKAYDSRLMRRLLGYMRPYGVLVTLSLVFLLIQSVLQVLGPQLTRIAVDKYLQPKGAATFLDPLLPAGAWDGLTRIALLYLIMLAGIFVTEFAQTYLMQYTGQLAMFDLRKQLMEHLQTARPGVLRPQPGRPPGDARHHRCGRAQRPLRIRPGDYSGRCAGAGVHRGDHVPLSPLLTAIMLAAMPLGDSGDRASSAAASRKATGASASPSRGSIPICRSTSPASWCCSFSTANGEARQEFDGVNRQHMEAYKDAITAYGWFYPVVEFLVHAGAGGILTYGGFRMQRGAL